MNICHVITRLIIGGAQENTLLTCEGLHARGHRVSLITGPECGPEGSLHDEARSAGYDVHILPSLKRTIHPLHDWRARKELTAVIRRITPDIVHTHSSKAGVLARIAARDAKVPIIVHTVHGSSFNRTQPWLIQQFYRGLEKYCARFTDRIISVADAMTAQMVAAGVAPANKFVTIYSGMRTEWFSPDRYDRPAIRRQLGVNEDDILIATVARLFKNKGYEQLIPAMAPAVRRSPNLQFVWVGDGAQRTRYEQQLETLGLRSRVHLTGLVPPIKVPEILAAADILVHASQWEGLPRVAIQALLMERPVISFNIDGAAEAVIPEKTGVLVPLNDIDGLASAMVTLASDAALRTRFGHAGRARCLERFDHQQMVSAIERMYEQLVQQKTLGKNRQVAKTPG